MPIYPYRCAACGFETEVMRKVSDPLLTTCPQCKSEQFSKQLTAPGFQLKGTGWYATDFKNSGSKPADKTAKASPETSTSTEAAPAATKPETTTATPTASSTTAAPVTGGSTAS